MSDDFLSLKQEVSLLRKQLNKQLDDIEQRVDGVMLRSMAARKSTQTEDKPSTYNLQSPRQQPQTTSTTPEQNKDGLVMAAMATEPRLQTSVSPVPRRQHTAREPSFITQMLLFLMNMFTDWLSPVINMYKSYQQRDMAGIFVITIIGIVLTLSGVGYLMQLLIDQLGAGSKSLLFSAIAFGVIGIGIYLKKNTTFDEFATAIVATGLLITYSTVYYSGSVFYVIEQMTTMALYVVIAFACHAFALWFNTRVLACLGIIGIAIMPILSGSLELHGLSYLISLGLVAISTLILSYKQNWQWLASLTLGFVIMALEWSITVENTQVQHWFINCFYLIFFAYAAMALIKDKAELGKTVMMLATAIGATILIFSQIHQTPTSATWLSFTALSAVSLFNTILALTLAKFLHKLKQPHSALVLLIAAAWAVVTIIALLSEQYWGIAWAIEGLLLIYIGKRFIMPSTINQGQGLTGVAVLYCFAAIVPYFPLPALQAIDGWLMSLALVAIIGIWQRLITAQKHPSERDLEQDLNPNETINSATINTTTKRAEPLFNATSIDLIKPGLQLLEAFWLAILTLSTLYMFVGEYTGALTIAVQVLLLIRAKQLKHVGIEILATLFILLPIVLVVISANEIGSFRFTLLPLFAQLALISAFVQLRLWAIFNNKFNPYSKLNYVAEMARVLFYLLIPIIWLNSALRILDEGIIQVLWLSPLIALLFANYLKHWLIVLQARILTLIAYVTFVLLAPFNSTIATVIAILGYSTLLVAGHLLRNKNQVKRHTLAKQANSTADNAINLTSNKQLKKLTTEVVRAGFMVFGFALPIFIAKLLGDSNSTILVALMAMAIYWGAAFIWMNKSVYLRSCKTFINYSNLVILLFSWFRMLADTEYVIVSSITLAAIIYGTVKSTSPQQRLKIGAHYDLFIHSFTAVTYSIALYSFNVAALQLLIGPVLAIHGVYILLNQSDELIKVKYGFTLMLIAIAKLALFDAINALLWQKVILFIGVGVFLLFAAFWYQKLQLKVKAELT